jgi:AcrR family transcriptional regulator
MTAKSRRLQHRAELRREILNTARRIFVKQGYESFSMRKLAQEIGYSPGSVYLHFKSKQELFGCLVEESFAHLLKVLMDLRGHEAHDPVRELKKGMRAYVEFGLRNPNDYCVAFMLPPSVENHPYKVHPAFQALRHMVGRCVDEKRFGRVDVETTSQVLWTSIHGITSLLIQRPTFPWVSRSKLIAQLIDTVVGGLVAS